MGEVRDSDKEKNKMITLMNYNCLVTNEYRKNNNYTREQINVYSGKKLQKGEINKYRYKKEFIKIKRWIGTFYFPLTNN